jgi:hypothetical protein
MRNRLPEPGLSSRRRVRDAAVKFGVSLRSLSGSGYTTYGVAVVPPTLDAR